MSDYRVVIVDDEKPIVEGLKAFINWEDEGFTVVGSALNGEAGVEMARMMNADLVLTDIRMPLLSGNGLIRQVKETRPDCAFIILSGYSDFEYAREAMSNGVDRYLLKPVQEEELRSALRQVRSRLDEINKSKQEIYNLQDHLRQLQATVMEHQLQELVAGQRYNEEQILEKWNSLNTGYPLDQFAVIVAEPKGLEKKYHDNSQALVYADYQISDLIMETVKELETGLAYRNPRGQSVVICCGTEKNTLTDAGLKSLAVTMRKDVQDKLGENVSVGVSLIHTSPDQLHTAYKQARKALEYQLLYDENRVICFRELSTETGRVFYPVELKKDLLDYIEMGDQERAHHLLIEILNHVTENKGNSPEIVYAVCMSLVVSMMNRAYLSGVPSEQLKDEIDRSLQIMMDRKSVLADLRENMESLLARAISYIAEQKKNQQRGVIGNIQKYVEEHYQENITLDFITDKFYINASYFSYLFKKKTGENFIDYLTSVRIEHAKKLLSNQRLKVYEVGDMVGYGSPRYFSQIFEKKVGMTPTEYRQYQFGSHPEE